MQGRGQEQNLVKLMQGRLGEAWKVLRLVPAAHDYRLRALPLDGALKRIHESKACLQVWAGNSSLRLVLCDLLQSQLACAQHMSLITIRLCPAVILRSARSRPISKLSESSLTFS